VNKKEAKKTLIFLLGYGRWNTRPKGSKSFFGSFFSKKELLSSALAACIGTIAADMLIKLKYVDFL
jgi:hypothetical protein